MTNDPLSSSNHRIKRLRKLVGRRKARSEERAFVVEGPVLVAEALAVADGRAIEAVYVDLDAVDDRAVAPVLDAAAAAGVTVETVVPGALASVLDAVTPRPICAVIGRHATSFDDLVAAAGPVLVLHELSEPGNVGTLVRTAEAAGFAGVLLTGDSVDPTNPKAVRASAGALFRLPVVERRDGLDALAGRRRRLATVVAGNDVAPHDAADLRDAAIVLGNEAHGLSPEAVAACDATITIPLAGPTESLNVAAAGAVLAFESLRQRRS